MKKAFARSLFITFLLSVFVAVAGCNQVTTSITTSSTTADDETTGTSASTTVTGPTFYLAGNFSGYIADDPDFIMTPVEDMDGWYEITVDLTADVRDNAYDGHYYKVTDGTWTTCYGTESYALQPAPVSPTGGGLGSIWIYDNGLITVRFDANTNTIYDDRMVRNLPNPVVYGDFSVAAGRGDDWAYDNESGLELLDPDENGVYEGDLTLPAYAGEAEGGYSVLILLSEKYFIGSWGAMWGANEQYKFDGTPAAMGSVSYLKPASETTYHFSFDSSSKVTTVTVEFENPVVYGDFSAWGFGADAIELTQSQADASLYTGSKVFPAYTGDGEGYSLVVCLSTQLYIGSWGESWGALEQYTLSGDAATMGKVTYLDLEEEMELVFTYDADTHVTTITPPETKSVAPFEHLAGPTLYGTFTIDTLDTEAFILEGENAAVMTLVAGETNLYEITLYLEQFTPRESGYYMEDTGYRFILVLTKSDVGWGYYAGEQYLLDGTPATMGSATIIDIDVTGNYRFVYNSDTNVTTWELVD